LCLRIRYDENIERKVKDVVTSTVEQGSDLESRGTEPGIVFLCGARIPKEIQAFAERTISHVVNLKDALRLLKKFGVEAVGFKGGRGIIGGLAAAGQTLRGDHTYELIAYRRPEYYGSKRKVDEASIFEMDEATAPYTFNNVDSEKNRVIITPRGPDPILFGIRGENPNILKRAFAMVRVYEPIERWVTFRTNQGTDAHLKHLEMLSQVKPYESVIVKGTVSRNPINIPRRHVIFSIKDPSGQVDCAAYEPTGSLRQLAARLLIGDRVEAYGAARTSASNRPLTINLEKIRVLKLAGKVLYQNPLCTKCGKRLKSVGKNKGFRCEKCGSRYRDLTKIGIPVKRELKRGLYLTATRSQRHLTKPLRRYGMEKSSVLVEQPEGEWHS
jgi:tRNA(Ile2)-agmatinylcytidine synthase